MILGSLIAVIVLTVLNSNEDDASDTAVSEDVETSVSGIASVETIHGGFMDYNNTLAAVELEPDIYHAINNDGKGPFSNRLYRPSGVTELMNVENGEIDPRELSLGDVMNVRQDFQITPQYNNALLESRYVLGKGQGEYTLPRQFQRLDDGSEVYRFSASTDLIYMGDENTLDNFIKFEVKCSSPFTLLNSGTAIHVVKYQPAVVTTTAARH